MNNEFLLELTSTLQQTKSRKQLNSDIKQLEKVINMMRLTGTFAKGNTKKELNAYIRQLSSQLSTIKLKGKIDSRNLKTEVDKALSNVSFRDIDLLNIDENKAKLKVRKFIADVKAYAERTPITIDIESKRNKLNNDLTAYLNRNTKINESSILLKEADKVRELVDAVNDKKSLRKATDAFQLYKSEVSATGFNTKSTTDKIKGMFSHVAKVGSALGLASMAMNRFSQSLNTLKTNDTILTEISKTSEMTKQQLRELGDKAFNVASKYGQLSGNYLTAIQEMTRAGYDDNAQEMAELSTKAQGAGDMAAELANKYIIATDKAYKMNGSIAALTETLDGANNIANNNALNMEDLAQGMSVVGSQAASSQMEVNETTAAVGTLIAVTQKSGSEMGNAFKGILMNLRQMTGEVEDGGDAIDETSLTKYEKACNELGVSLSTVKNGIVSLKEPMQILKELSEEYTKLDDSDARRANLLSAVGGKYRANALNAILENYGLYEKMLDDYDNGIGSMDEEVEKTANSWEGRLNSLSNSFDSFVNTLTNKGAVLNGISFFDGFIQGAEKLTNIIGEIPVVLTTLNTAMTAVNKNYGITQILNPETNKLDIQGNMFGIDFTAIKEQKKHFGEAEIAIGGWNRKLEQGITDINSFNNATVQNNAQLKAYLATTSMDAPASLSGYKSYLNAAGVSTDALRLKTLLMTSALTMGLSLGIQAVVSIISSFVTATSRMRESAKEFGSQFSSIKSEIEDYKTKVEELHAVINSSGSSIEDVTEARKNLLSIQDELIGKFGSEKSAVESITKAVNGQTEAFDELSQRQWQEVKNEFNDSGFGNDMLNLFDGYGSNIDRMLDEYGNYEVKVDLSSASGNYKSKEAQEIRELLESNGMEISYTMNGKGVPFVELSGTADEVYDKIVEIQELFSEDNPLSSDIFRNYLTDLANSAKDMSEQYKEMYDNYILYEEVLKDNSYRDSFKGITEAYEEYRAADISGDEEAIDKARDNYASVVESAMEEAFKNGNTGVADYFKSMYPELQDAIEQWEFKAKVLPDFDISGLKGKTENDVLEMLQTDGMQDGEETFNSLIEKATEHGIVTGNNSQKVQQLLDLLAELGILQGETSEGQANAQDSSIPSFTRAFGSLDTDVQQRILDLAKSGEITPSVLESTEEYAKLLTDTELSAESVKNQILDMLSAQEKLAGAANGLDKLKSSYEQFKETGFVTAQSLESLPDAFKELDGYDLFTEIVGDPTQGEDVIQQAFNGIVGEYLISQDTLSGLVNASESEVQSYIANLKDMGVTNAEEVVNAAIQVLSQENELLNAAEKEYMNYLMAKDGYDDEYLKSVTSKNGQLVAALGEPYMADYNNWCNLMKQKAEVYNRFVLSLKASGITNSSGAPLSNKGFAEQQADKILKDTANGTKNIYDPNSTTGMYFGKVQKPGTYTLEQVKMARQIKSQGVKQQNLKDQLSLGLSTIDTNYGGGYSPKGLGGSSGSDGSSKDTKEEAEKEFSELFDWIERRIKKFQSSFDKWVKQAETAVTTNFVNKYYKKAQSSAKSQLSNYGKAYNRYMRKANAVGLDEKYAKKVRNGTINIEEIYAKGTEDDIKKYEELADNIKEYQDWYDKAQDSMDSFMETAEKLYSLPLETATRKVDIFRDAIDLLGKEIDNETDYIKKNKKIDRQTQKEKKILDSNKTAATDTKKSLSSARKELRKNRNLNADDGITKKERKTIRKAAKGSKEVNLSYFKENSAGYKAAVKYNEALKARKKAINDVKSAQQDYDAWEVEASKLKFDNVADHYSKEVQMIGYDMTALDDRISEIEASGRKVHKSYYEDQKAVNQKKLAQYQSEKAALEQSIQNIKKGTDEWYDAYDQIQQVSSSISDCNKETYELNDAISQLHFDMVDDTTEGIKRIITEQEFLRGLFAHEKNTDKKTGGLTDAGLANLGSLSVGYHASKENASRLAAEVAELQRMLDAGVTYSSVLGIELNSIDNVEKRLNEARATEQEWVKEWYDNSSAIHGIMEELYNAELDYLKELVDAKKEALDAEKDLHDYQRTISEKAEGIAAIQKQIAAYSGDTSEEGQAKLQRLQKELDDRKDDLKETEYDRYISDQKEMLDNLYDEYSKNMEEKLEDFMAIVQEGLDKADDNMSAIRDFLGEVASRNGYETAVKGLFDSKFVLNGSDGTTSNTGIGDNARDAALQVAAREGKRYESTKQGTTQPTDPPFKNNFTEPGSKTMPQQPELETILYAYESADDAREKAKKYIGKKAIKATKKKKEYSDVSQKVYENKAKSYDGTGKVLTTAAMKGLAKLLGIKYDNPSKKGNLYKTLKKIKFPGFSNGGVVSVGDIERQVHENGDDGLVSVRNGEGILNPKETKGFKKLVRNADGATGALGAGELITVQPDMLKSISDLALKNIATGINGMVKPNVPDFCPVGTNNTTNIDIGGIIMNGVNDPEELSRQIVRSIQKYPRAQKAIHATSTDILAGMGNTLSIKSIR